jgi:altronate hydrolase
MGRSSPRQMQSHPPRRRAVIGASSQRMDPRRHPCAGELSMKETLLIAEPDNVVVALRDLGRGATTDAGLRLATDVPAGHKVAIRRIPAGEKVVKYGYPIGVASVDIQPGEHVHNHNLVSTLRDDISVNDAVPVAAPTAREAAQPATFEGYRRADGRVGIRNEIWIINTVGCVNNAAERIAAAATQELVQPGSNIDGVYAFKHPYGCSQLGHDLDHTQKVLAGLVHHPNAAAVLILGLGCENNQLASFLGQVGPMGGERLASFNAQEVEDEVEEGLERVRQLARYASRFRRESVPASELILGMKCGGSDGLSGITANPLVGKVANRLAALGGSVLLTEVPEMFGAEGVLLERASSPQVARDTIELVNRFRAYFRRYDEPIDENPAPGNKAGGITTLAEKSLGCVQKAGQAPVARVLDYGEPAPSGLGGTALVNAPGNDGVSSTALVAAGAHMVLFTTGRGTPMGFPAPTIKISTNSSLATRKPSWIDFDAGPIALGTSDFGSLSEQLFQLVLDVASGRQRTKSELNGFREISIWKDGVTL